MGLLESNARIESRDNFIVEINNANIGLNIDLELIAGERNFFARLERRHSHVRTARTSERIAQITLRTCKGRSRHEFGYETKKNNSEDGANKRRTLPQDDLALLVSTGFAACSSARPHTQFLQAFFFLVGSQTTEMSFAESISIQTHAL